VESVSFSQLRDDGAEVWLLREYLRCDRACEKCTVTFRLTVYSSSPTACVIEYRGEHGARTKELKLRTGVTVINRVHQLLDTGVARTPGQVQRHLQRALLQEPLTDVQDPAFASPFSARFQSSYGRVSQCIVRHARKYVGAGRALATSGTTG
jgi:hypothetical protein